MLYQVFSVKDRAADAFGRPVFGNSTGASLRSFTDEVNRNAPENEMYRHAEDFELYHLGAFDDGSGEFILFPAPKLLVRGDNVKT
jgi:hypothetical protein